MSMFGGNLFSGGLSGFRNAPPAPQSPWQSAMSKVQDDFSAVPGYEANPEYARIQRESQQAGGPGYESWLGNQMRGQASDFMTQVMQKFDKPQALRIWQQLQSRPFVSRTQDEMAQQANTYNDPTAFASQQNDYWQAMGNNPALAKFRPGAK